MDKHKHRWYCSSDTEGFKKTRPPRIAGDADAAGVKGSAGGGRGGGAAREQLRRAIRPPLARTVGGGGVVRLGRGA